MKTIKIEKQDYTNCNYMVFGDETDLCKEIEQSDSNYICDAISEHVDSFVPIYNNELWKYAADCRDYIEQAIEEGLTEGCNDLMRIFAMGIYLYYQEMANEELKTIAFNVMCDALKDIDFKDETDESDIESIMDELSENFDHNDSWSTLIEKFKNECADLIEDEE